SDLKLTVSGITFAARAGDTWGHGTITITIHNGGPAPAGDVKVNLTFGKGQVRHEGSGWSACTSISDQSLGDGRGAIEFDLRQPLAVGQTRTLVLGVTAYHMTGNGQARVSNYRTAGNAQGGPYMVDPAPADNQATFTMH